MKRLLFLHIILLFGVLAWAQTPASTLPYECSFEASEDLSAWVLNPLTPNAADKWVIGSAAHSEGRRSLYISADGLNPNYNKKPNVVAAYLRYQFPQSTAQGHYDISFDWKGQGDSLHSRLYVMICPEQALTVSGSGYELSSMLSETSGRLSPPPPNLKSYVWWMADETMYTEQYVCGSETWQNVTLQELTINPSFSSYTWAIVFLWENDNTTDSLTRTSIAIDNLQICSAAYPKPTNLEVDPICEDSSMIVSWESTLTEFEVQYRSVGTSAWKRFSGISLENETEGFSRDGNKCTYVLKPVLEGSYDVRVRGLAGEETTGWVYKTLILVYCPDNHCINYLRLDGDNVKCTYGKHEAHQGETPFDNVGIIDYGPDSENSKHTIHVDPTEVDLRADGILHTVPPGELASVRLGNWNPDGNAQSITYSLVVDTATQGILIMKYAVVLDNSGHERYEEPYFRIEVLDSLDNRMELCGQADFTYSDAVLKSQEVDSWHLTTYNGEEVAWKDWTVVGVSLMEYHNQKIKIRITSADCGQWVHFGYGYFTLDCANAHIETENCGSDARLIATAPEGFSYDWRTELGPLEDGQRYNRELDVPASTHTYTCKVSFKEDPSCYFEVSTVSAPRFPVPEYSFERIYSDCTSKLKFTNTSHVMTKYENEENHTTEACTDFNWIFRRLSDGSRSETGAKAPTYTAPVKGDSIEVTYTCFIGSGEGNMCDSTRVDTIIVPDIRSEATEFHYKSCSEEPVKFGDNFYNESTVVTETFKNYAGCDSVSTMFLEVYPKPQELHIHDSICSTQSLTIAGVKYTQPMDNYLIMLKNENGCDSAIYLTLTVNQLLHATVDSLPYSCADEGQMFILFDITAGVYDSLVINFNTPQLRDTTIYDQVTSVAIPYSEDILPGHYSATLTFHQFCCGIYSETRGFDIRYPSSIVDQKWNDVLTLLSPKYNGGYEFLSFQWYKDNVPMIGETHSYLYQPLDFNSEYYVELMRKDSVIMKTCPIQPVYHEQQTAYPTIVQAGQHMPMYMDHPVTIWYYTAAGQLYSTFDLPQGYTSLPTPGQPGVFVIKSVNSEGETQAQVMVVE